ncbi:MAG: phosphatidylserine/phosphatidylglycerophosphate/cardiolipin synthase family protein, partial [Patescibacteria group bacterium]
IFVDDEAGSPFFDLLETKAKAGIDVKLIVDSFGSFWLSKKRMQSLKDAGVDARFFHERARYRGWWRMMVSRSHRKILVVDETVGFIGGVIIDRRMKEWLDIHMRVEGHIVRSLLRSFARSYMVCGGDGERVRYLLAYRFRVKKYTDDATELLTDNAGGSTSRVRKRYMEALLKARERVILFSPYYFPDRKFLQAMWRARKRGIKIDLLLPLRTDIRLATYAAYSFFSLMKAFGINVRLTTQMMHGKGMIVDDDEAIVGSSNLDPTSFYDNYEAGLHIRDKGFVTRLKKTVDGWMADAVGLDDMKWEKRGWRAKVKERFVSFLYRLWHRKRI